MMLCVEEGRNWSDASVSQRLPARMEVRHESNSPSASVLLPPSKYQMHV